MRSSRFTALELAQTLRYLPDLVVVLALLAAVGFCAPNRARVDVAGCLATRAPPWSSPCAALFVVSSLYSTVDVHADLARQPDAGVSAHHTGEPRDGERRPRPRRCSTRRSTRWCCSASRRRRTCSATCSPSSATGPNSTRAQPDLRMIDMSGRLLDAKVTWVRFIATGSDAAVRLPRPARRPGPDPARRSAAARGLDRRDQLPRQQRRLDDVVAAGRRRREGEGATRAEPRVRPTARRGRRHPGACRHVGAVGVRGVRTRRVRGTEVGRLPTCQTSKHD